MNRKTEKLAAMQKVRTAILIVALVVASRAHANERRAPVLSPDMTAYDVVRQYGAPTAKIEREAKREVIWRYGIHNVVIRNGHVVARRASPVPSGAIDFRDVPREASAARAAPAAVSDHTVKETREILTEIMDQYPGSEEDSGSPKENRPMASGLGEPPPVGINTMPRELGPD